MITSHDKAKCAERELALRKKVYPRWISEGRMTHREARHELECMALIAQDYRELAEKDEEEGRLL